MGPEYISRYLKKFSAARALNAHLKSQSTKRRYHLLCRRYGTPSILNDPSEIKKLGSQLWSDYQNKNIKTPKKRKRVLYVSADFDQDRTGIIQGLSELSDLTLFHHSESQYGQLWPRTKSEVEKFRIDNGKRLEHMISSTEASRPFDLIIGQMWGFSMHWKVLTKAREMGIGVVNIAMDDRHAFIGQKLEDGTWGGTLGLAPYLSAACTDAPECVQWYEKEGCRSFYFPEASDPGIFRPSSSPKLYDACFVGANYGIRARMVQALEYAGINVRVFGQGWPNGRISFDQIPDLFAQSRIILGCGTIGYCDDFLALKLRDFDGPMSGSLYMTHDNPDLYPLFAVGEEIVTFKTVDEAVEKARQLLSHSEERERKAATARQRAVVEHTWKNRFEFLLSEI